MKLTTQRHSLPAATCYERIWGPPDEQALAEMAAISAYLPSSPSPELLILIACSVHHRCAERAAADAMTQRQAQLQGQIDVLTAAVGLIEQRRELRFAAVHLVSSVAILAGAVYLACCALAEPHGRVVAVMQCTVALVVALTGARMLWRPR